LRWGDVALLRTLASRLTREHAKSMMGQCYFIVIFGDEFFSLSSS
jgi:hypothetical protein